MKSWTEVCVMLGRFHPSRIRQWQERCRAAMREFVITDASETLFASMYELGKRIAERRERAIMDAFCLPLELMGDGRRGYNYAAAMMDEQR